MLQMSMSKLSLKVLLGVLALMFSASVGLSAAPECRGSPHNLGFFGSFGIKQGWHNCNGEIFRKREKRSLGYIPSDRVEERYRRSAKGLWKDGLLVQGTKVDEDGTYEGTWEYQDGHWLSYIFKGKVTYIDGTTFNGQIGKLTKWGDGNRIDPFAWIGTLRRPNGTVLTGEFKEKYTSNWIDTFDQLQLISSSVVKSAAVNRTSHNSSNLSLLKAEFIKLSDEDRRFVQTRLADLRLYSSSIDSLYGKNTESALNAYNKEYLANADLNKTANAKALLKDILTPKVLEGEQVDADKSSKTFASWSDDIICKYVINKGRDIHIAEAQRRGLYCGVVGKDIPKQTATVEQPKAQPAPEATPKLDLAQVKASYDAKDYTKAFADAQVLAVQGDPETQLLLGKMFADGRGTIQVSTLAHMWFNIASMGGIDEAYEQRKAITAQMTPAAVEEAQKMAMKCIQSNYADCGLTVKTTEVKQPKPVPKTYITSGHQVEAWFKDETQLRRKQLHYALKKLGVYNSSIDGLWGKNTSRAFTRFINKYKRDAETVEEVFASILSKVKVPSAFAEPQRVTTTKSNPNANTGRNGWVPINDNPKLSFDDASEICEAKAIAEGNSYINNNQPRDRRSSIDCDSYGFNSFSCSRSRGGGASTGILRYLDNAENYNAGKKLAQAVAKACMADYGWVKR